MFKGTPISSALGFERVLKKVTNLVPYLDIVFLLYHRLRVFELKIFLLCI